MCVKSFRNLQVLHKILQVRLSAKEYIDAREELEVLARFINDCRNPAAAVSEPAQPAQPWPCCRCCWPLFSGDRRCTMSGLKKDPAKAVPWL